MGEWQMGQNEKLCKMCDAKAEAVEYGCVAETQLYDQD